MNLPLPSLIARALLLLLGALIACDDDSDPEPDGASDGGATLSVELFWDSQPESAEFAGEGCDSAGVNFMEWELIESANDRIVDGNAQPCADAMDVIGLSSGTYELDITGIDEDDNPLWRSTCTDLVLAGSDVSYDCNVRAP